MKEEEEDDEKDVNKEGPETFARDVHKTFARDVHKRLLQGTFAKRRDGRTVIRLVE